MVKIAFNPLFLEFLADHFNLSESEMYKKLITPGYFEGVFIKKNSEMRKSPKFVATFAFGRFVDLPYFDWHYDILEDDQNRFDHLYKDNHLKNDLGIYIDEEIIEFLSNFTGYRFNRVRHQIGRLNNTSFRADQDPSWLRNRGILMTFNSRDLPFNYPKELKVDQFKTKVYYRLYNKNGSIFKMQQKKYLNPIEKELEKMDSFIDKALEDSREKVLKKLNDNIDREMEENPFDEKEDHLSVKAIGFDRNVGKTTTLIQEANRNKAFLVVPLNTNKKDAQEYAKKNNLKDVKIVSATEYFDRNVMSGQVSIGDNVYFDEIEKCINAVSVGFVKAYSTSAKKSEIEKKETTIVIKENFIK